MLRNPLLFKQLFWAKYVEDVGGGTLDMIKQCREWGIPEPVFEHITGAFVVSFRLPPALEDLERLGLNERQIKAMDNVIKKGFISNKEYTSLNNISRKTATIDLTQLVTKGLLIRVGEGKRGIHYILPKYAKNYAKNYAKLRWVFLTGYISLIPESGNINLESLELNERQKKAIEYLKIHKNITRKIYIEINNISPRQANKDLNDLLEKKLIRKQGRERAISYALK